MRYSSRKKRKYIIIGLCLVLLLMVVGYASFSTVLTINSSSEITSSWDVEITNVRGVNDASLTYNDAYDKVAPSISESKLSVTIQTGLLSPGDTRIYEIEVSNLGNLDSEVTTSFQNKINDSTLFTYDGVSPVGSVGTDILTSSGSYDSSLLETEEPFFIPAFTNNKRYIYLTIKYKDSVTSQPSDLNPNVTLSLNVSQKSHDSSTSSFGVETVTKGEVEIPVVNSGDGLYKDETEEGRYIYRGGNPDNYITFNGETAGWRIVSFENDGTIKIVKKNAIVAINFDSQNRVVAENSYCTDTRGCNFFASSSSTLDRNGQHVSSISYNDNIYNLPLKDSKANQFLNSFDSYENNGFYFNLLQDSKNLIVMHNFPIGIVNDVSDINDVINDENRYYFRGNVGMLNVSDVMNSFIDNASYINQDIHWQWLLNPTSSNFKLWSILGGSSLGKGVVYYGSGSSISISPTVYLKSDVRLTGNGSLTEPFEIKTE